MDRLWKTDNVRRNGREVAFKIARPASGKLKMDFEIGDIVTTTKPFRLAPESVLLLFDICSCICGMAVIHKSPIMRCQLQCHC